MSNGRIAENESEREGVLELEVTDFGPIAEARVDLRPLAVFVGPSTAWTSGRSYGGSGGGMRASRLLLRSAAAAAVAPSCARYLSIRSACTKASLGMSTRPTCRIRFLPSFCLSSSLRLRLTSPP